MHLFFGKAGDNIKKTIVFMTLSVLKFECEQTQEELTIKSLFQI